MLPFALTCIWTRCHVLNETLDGLSFRYENVPFGFVIRSQSWPLLLLRDTSTIRVLPEKNRTKGTLFPRVRESDVYPCVSVGPLGS